MRRVQMYLLHSRSGCGLVNLQVQINSRNPRFSGSTTVQDIFELHIRNEQLPESTFIQFQHALGAEMNPSVRWTIGRLTKYIQMEELCLNWKVVVRIKNASFMTRFRFPVLMKICTSTLRYTSEPLIKWFNSHTTILRSLWNMERWVMVILSQFIRKTMQEGCLGLIVQDSTAWFDHSGWTSPSGPIGFVSRDDRNLAFSRLATHQAFTKIYCCDCHDQRCRPGHWAHLWSKLNVFPPPLRTAKDNFFAKEQIDTQNNHGIHMGILAPPRRARCDRTANNFFAPNRSKSQGKWSENMCWPILDPRHVLQRSSRVGRWSISVETFRDGCANMVKRLNQTFVILLKEWCWTYESEKCSRIGNFEAAFERHPVHPSVVDVYQQVTCFRLVSTFPDWDLSIIGQPRSNSRIHSIKWPCWS